MSGLTRNRKRIVVVRRHGKLPPRRHEELTPLAERIFHERKEARSFPAEGDGGEGRDADAGRCVGDAGAEVLRLEIAGQSEKVFFFVATLGYFRRLHVRAFRGERQEHWFAGMESAFASFGGVPEEVLLDNARALIQHHDPVSREVVVNPKLHAFARHWGFAVKACAPYRARTKGKDERGVGYVKKNAIAGPRATMGRFSVNRFCLDQVTR